jgi:hypothetical protein
LCTESSKPLHSHTFLLAHFSRPSKSLRSPSVGISTPETASTSPGAPSGQRSAVKHRPNYNESTLERTR